MCYNSMDKLTREDKPRVDGLNNALESNVVNYKSEGSLGWGGDEDNGGRKTCYQHYGGNMPALYWQWLYHFISSLSAYEPGTSMWFVWEYDHKFTHTIMVFLIQTNRVVLFCVCVYDFFVLFVFWWGSIVYK